VGVLAPWHNDAWTGDSQKKQDGKKKVNCHKKKENRHYAAYITGLG
jgi:hypothetical protein